MNRKKIEQFLLSVLFPLAVGTVSGLLTGGARMKYQEYIKPALSPSPTVFPIVWTILYLLMGIGAYLIWTSENKDSSKAMRLYFIQLAVNFLWPIFFFRLNWFLFAFVWIILLVLLVVKMIRAFAKINKTAALLQIPYLIWLLFASYLSFMVYYLNR